MDRSSSYTLSKLDIFPKIDSCFTRSSLAGGTVSMFTYIIIVFVLIMEIMDYLSNDVTYKYSVDTVFDKKLNINIDITVATPCSKIGADVMDSTNKHSMYTYGNLAETKTNFQLTGPHLEQWNEMKRLNSFIRNEHHNIHGKIWKTDYGFAEDSSSKMSDGQETLHIGREDNGLVLHFSHSDMADHGGQYDSCRLHGTLMVNKVSGNFHIAAGKYIPLPIGHAHISLIESEKMVNFSHRIEKFSFGDGNVPRMVNTLDGVEKITKYNNHLYQYYLKVVLTNVQTLTYQGETYQYSVTERDLIVNHDAGQHGIPGIYFKYDIEALKIDVIQKITPLWKFAIRICAIVGGVVELSILLNQFTTYLIDR